MGHSHGSIHVIRLIHEETVPMQTCFLVSQAIVHIHNHPVAFVDLNGRNWPFSIDADDFALKFAIGVRGGPGYVEVVGDGFREYAGEKC